MRRRLTGMMSRRSVPAWSRRLVLVVLWAVAPARAQVLYTQDFEAPGVGGPGPAWSATSIDPAVVTSADGAAAHSGDAGLRLRVGASGGRLASFETAFTATGSVYVRGFVRVTSGSPTGFSPLVSQATAIGTIGELTHRTAPDASTYIDVRSSTVPAGGGVNGVVQHRVNFGEWHLLEYVMSGIGSADASVTGAVDGVVFETLKSNWSGVSYRRLRLGTASGYLGGASVIDLDDVVVSKTPLYSRLLLSAEDAGNGCAQLVATLGATFPDAAFLGPVQLRLDSVDGGVFVSCGATATAGTLNGADAAVEFGAFAGAVGGTRVRVSAPGYAWAELDLSASAGSDGPDAGVPAVDSGVSSDSGVVETEPDAGAPAGPPLDLGVSFGCQAVPAGSVLGALWLSWALGRRSRRGER